MADLYIFELRIYSSYANNNEFPATELHFDTIQWWVNEIETWRIRLFDADSDIHVHKIQNRMSIDEIDQHMKTHYADVLYGRYNFSNISIHHNSTVLEKMKSGRLEISRDYSFAFWNHDDRQYHTQSHPRTA